MHGPVFLAGLFGRRHSKNHLDGPLCCGNWYRQFGLGWVGLGWQCVFWWPRLRTRRLDRRHCDCTYCVHFGTVLRAMLPTYLFLTMLGVAAMLGVFRLVCTLLWL